MADKSNKGTRKSAQRSARERLAMAKQPKVVELAKAFGGMQPGDMMYVATPQIVADYLQQIPYGETRSMPELRAELARANDCDGSCPLSTAIFLRVAAEAALEDVAEGRALSEVIPFWRAVEPHSKIASRLDVDAAWIALQREHEGAG